MEITSKSNNQYEPRITRGLKNLRDASKKALDSDKKTVKMDDCSTEIETENRLVDVEPPPISPTQIIKIPKPLRLNRKSFPNPIINQENSKSETITEYRQNDINTNMERTDQIGSTNELKKVIMKKEFTKKSNFVTNENIKSENKFFKADDTKEKPLEQVVMKITVKHTEQEPEKDKYRSNFECTRREDEESVAFKDKKISKALQIIGLTYVSSPESCCEDKIDGRISQELQVKQDLKESTAHENENIISKDAVLLNLSTVPPVLKQKSNWAAIIDLDTEEENTDAEEAHPNRIFSENISLKRNSFFEIISNESSQSGDENCARENTIGENLNSKSEIVFEAITSNKVKTSAKKSPQDRFARDRICEVDAINQFTPENVIDSNKRMNLNAQNILQQLDDIFQDEINHSKKENNSATSKKAASNQTFSDLEETIESFLIKTEKDDVPESQMVSGPSKSRSRASSRNRNTSENNSPSNANTSKFVREHQSQKDSCNKNSSSMNQNFDVFCQLDEAMSSISSKFLDIEDELSGFQISKEIQTPRRLSESIQLHNEVHCQITNTEIKTEPLFAVENTFTSPFSEHRENENLNNKQPEEILKVTVEHKYKSFENKEETVEENFCKNSNDDILLSTQNIKTEKSDKADDESLTDSQQIRVQSVFEKRSEPEVKIEKQSNELKNACDHHKIKEFLSEVVDESDFDLDFEVAQTFENGIDNMTLTIPEDAYEKLISIGEKGRKESEKPSDGNFSLLLDELQASFIEEVQIIEDEDDEDDDVKMSEPLSKLNPSDITVNEVITEELLDLIEIGLHHKQQNCISNIKQEIKEEPEEKNSKSDIQANNEEIEAEEEKIEYPLPDLDLLNDDNQIDKVYLDMASKYVKCESYDDAEECFTPDNLFFKDEEDDNTDCELQVKFTEPEIVPEKKSSLLEEFIKTDRAENEQSHVKDGDEYNESIDFSLNDFKANYSDFLYHTYDYPQLNLDADVDVDEATKKDIRFKVLMAVRKRPGLYDTNSKDYWRYRYGRTDGWKEVENDIGIDGAECRRIWRRLRQSFNTRQRTGTKGTRLMQLMSFLEPYSRANALLRVEDESETALRIQIIRTVKKYPQLYDRKHPGFHSRTSTWEKVAEELGVPASTCSAIWRNVRKNYCTRVTKHGGDIIVPNTSYDLEIQFLRPHLLIDLAYDKEKYQNKPVSQTVDNEDFSEGALFPLDYYQTLLELMKNHPQTYDPHHPDYRNVTAFKGLAVEMNTKEDRLLKDWQKLKMGYAKGLRQRQKGVQNVKIPYEKEMKWYHSYLFSENKMKRRLNSKGLNDPKMQLIDSIRRRPIIYDRRITNAPSNVQIENAWETISKEVNLTVADCKYRWVYLRNCYKKRRLVDRNNKWRFNNVMKFYGDYIDDIENGETTIRSTELSPPTPTSSTITQSEFTGQDIKLHQSSGLVHQIKTGNAGMQLPPPLYSPSATASFIQNTQGVAGNSISFQVSGIPTFSQPILPILAGHTDPANNNPPHHTFPIANPSEPPPLHPILQNILQVRPPAVTAVGQKSNQAKQASFNPEILGKMSGINVIGKPRKQLPTDNFKRQLISVIRDQFPHLYDPNHPEFTKKLKQREASWIKVGEVLNTPMHRCRKIWADLKAMFTAVSTGRTIKEKAKDNRFYDELQFLQPCILFSASSLPGCSSADGGGIQSQEIMNDFAFRRALIHAIRNHPQIYDHCHPDFTRSAEGRKPYWHKIADQFKSDPKKCSEMWKLLRNTYAGTLRAKRSGEKSSWRFEDDMSFMEPFVSTNNINEETLLRKDDTRRKLIAAIVRHPSLYDNSFKPTKSKKNDVQAWLNVSKETGLTTKQCIRIWHGIRREFSEFVFKPATQTEASNYEYHEELAFLRPYLNEQDQDIAKEKYRLSLPPPEIRDDTFIRNFLATIKQHPAVYTAHEHFFDRNAYAIHIAWKRISAIVGMLPAQCREEWKRLRQLYKDSVNQNTQWEFREDIEFAHSYIVDTKKVTYDTPEEGDAMDVFRKKLIPLVAENPLVYETNHDDQSKKTWHGASLWKFIAEKLQENKEKCRITWHRLRTRYTQYLDAIKKGKISRFRYEKEMSVFLDYFVGSQVLQELEEQGITEELTVKQQLVETFIATIRNYVQVYDGDIVESARKDAWELIARTLNISPENCFHIWTGICSIYVRILKREKDSINDMVTWKFQAQMEFLEPFLIEKQPLIPSNICVSTQEQEFVERFFDFMVKNHPKLLLKFGDEPRVTEKIVWDRINYNLDCEIGDCMKYWCYNYENRVFPRQKLKRKDNGDESSYSVVASPVNLVAKEICQTIVVSPPKISKLSPEHMKRPRGRPKGFVVNKKPKLQETKIKTEPSVIETEIEDDADIAQMPGKYKEMAHRVRNLPKDQRLRNEYEIFKIIEVRRKSTETI